MLVLYLESLPEFEVLPSKKANSLILSGLTVSSHNLSGKAIPVLCYIHGGMPFGKHPGQCFLPSDTFRVLDDSIVPCGLTKFKSSQVNFISAHTKYYNKYKLGL